MLEDLREAASLAERQKRAVLDTEQRLLSQLQREDTLALHLAQLRESSSAQRDMDVASIASGVSSSWYGDAGEDASVSVVASERERGLEHELGSQDDAA